MNKQWRATVTVACLLATFEAAATDITFDNLAVGTTVSTQYAGVTFSPNAFSGTGAPDGTWATNTDMTIVSATGGNVGALGAPNLVSGNVLRSFSAWTSENGDPSFRVSFGSAISSFSADFAGVDTPADVRLFAFNGASLLGTVVGTTTGQFTLTFAAARITNVVVTPGDFFDYVAVDNIRYLEAISPVPEPTTWAFISVGLVALAWARWRKVMPSNTRFFAGVSSNQKNMGLTVILKQHANSNAAPTGQTEPHFDEVARQAGPSDLSCRLSAAFRSNSTPAFGQTIGRPASSSST